MANELKLKGLFVNGPYTFTFDVVNGDEEQAKALAQRASGTTPQRRIETLYRIALGRLPKPEETTLALDYIQNEPDNKGWERFAKVLLASNEFMFID